MTEALAEFLGSLSDLERMAAALEGRIEEARAEAEACRAEIFQGDNPRRARERWERAHGFLVGLLVAREMIDGAR